jgi:hypothetical protein
MKIRGKIAGFYDIGFRCLDGFSNNRLAGYLTARRAGGIIVFINT